MKEHDLMSYEEYSELDHIVPYVFHLENKDQHLYYYGCKHSFDSTDPEFQNIEAAWYHFLELTRNKNCIALIEGGNRRVLETKEEAIREGGEMSFIAYLAHKDTVETFSPEPDAAYRYSTLLQKFSKEEIAYYDFALVCYQWNKYIEKPNFTEYVNKFLVLDKKNSGWNDFDFSIENILTIHKKLFKTEFKENDSVFFNSILDPMSTKSVINKISLFEESGLRDGYIVKEIERFWKMGKNIFVIYGVSHAVIQEKALNAIVLK